MKIFADYIEIKRDFIPVFTEEGDKNHPQSWKSFIPHDGFHKILSCLIKALDRGKSSEIKPLWIHGAYGTGKTFASFVVKHLFEDDHENIKDYIEKHQRGYYDLWKRLKGLRERGKYVLVYRSSSSNLDSSLKFLAEIQSSIKKSLKENGFDYLGGKTLGENIVEKIADPNSSFNWQKAFDKHREEFLEFSSADDVIEKIEREDIELTSKVAQILDDESFLVLDSAERTKDWIHDVIEENSLGGIIFIWDEFSDFFSVCPTTDCLQELAQASAGMPFYLFLITHKTPDRFMKGDEATAKKLLDRFNTIHFEMNPVTAYRLIANVIDVKSDMKEEWEIKKTSLWDRVSDIAISIMREEGRKEDFRGVIPIHPYSAFLLAKISTMFTSSQRTLFRFLKEDTPSSFVSFLREYPYEEQYWYTMDMLWEYFFSEDNPELIDKVRDIVSYYRSRINSINNEDEKNLFKGILLLKAISSYQSGEELLRPRRSILDIAFHGTHLSERLVDICKNLCNSGILHNRTEGFVDEEYTIPTMRIDREKLEDYKNKIRLSYKFDDIIEKRGIIGKELMTLFEVDGSLQRRQILTSVSASNLINKRDRITERSIKPYQINIIIVVGQNEEEIRKAEKSCEELAKEDTIFAIIQTPFSKEKWEELVEQQARALYCEEIKDLENQKYHYEQVEKSIVAWREEVRHMKIIYMYQKKPVPINFGYRYHIEEIIKRIYHQGPEKILSTPNTLYKESYGKKGAQIGLGVASKIQSPEKELVEKLKSDGIWGDKRWFKKRPNYPLSGMKREVDEAFGKSEKVNLQQLLVKLQCPPYGLIPSPVGITLFAFLLRDYKEGYYWTDGKVSLPLNPDKLCELINDVMHEKRNAQDYAICKISLLDTSLCELLREIFNLSPEKTQYPEETKKTLRDYFTNLGYPLWSLSYWLQEDYYPFEDISKLIDYLGSMIKSPKDDSIGLPDNEQKEHIVKLLENNKDEIKRLITRNNFVQGMKRFFNREYEPLNIIIHQLDASFDSVMKRVRFHLSEEVWLWEKDKVQACLPKLYSEYKLIDALNDLCGIKARELDEALNLVDELWLKNSKLPLWFYSETISHKDLQEILKQLNNILYESNFDYDFDFPDLVKNKKEEIRSLIQDKDSAIIHWAKNNLNLNINSNEASEIYSKLDDLSREKSKDEFERNIRRAINDLKKGKLIRELRTQWKEYSGFSSTKEWCKKFKIPIRWIFPDQDYIRFFDVIDNPDNKSEKELEEKSKWLADHGDELKILKDNSFVNKLFTKNILSEFSSFFREESNLDEIKNHLQERLGSNYGNWQDSKVKKHISEWVTNNYLDKHYPEVIAKINNITEGEAKELLKKLAKDPHVGTILLKSKN